MSRDTEAIRSERDGIPWEVRPEWLAGRYWFRIYINGHPKVLMRHQDNAAAVADALAADEAQFRREAGIS
jgi:hypothetical protein